jgi:hypothetical protein
LVHNYIGIIGNLLKNHTNGTTFTCYTMHWIFSARKRPILLLLKYEM